MEPGRYAPGNTPLKRYATKMILQKTLFLEFRGHHCPSRAGFIRGKIRREILPGGAIPAKSHKLLFRFRYYVSQRTQTLNPLRQFVVAGPHDVADGDLLDDLQWRADWRHRR